MTRRIPLLFFIVSLGFVFGLVPSGGSAHVARGGETRVDQVDHSLSLRPGFRLTSTEEYSCRSPSCHIVDDFLQTINIAKLEDGSFLQFPRDGQGSDPRLGSLEALTDGRVSAWPLPVVARPSATPTISGYSLVDAASLFDGGSTYVGIWRSNDPTASPRTQIILFRGGSNRERLSPTCAAHYLLATSDRQIDVVATDFPRHGHIWPVALISEPANGSGLIVSRLALFPRFLDCSSGEN
jgi:hypothetical protein